MSLRARRVYLYITHKFAKENHDNIYLGQEQITLNEITVKLQN